MANRVLVIDDDRETQHGIEAFLAGQDWTVQAAHSSAQGRTLLSEEPFNLVVVKTDMPDLSGTAIIDNLRSSGGRNRGVRVLGLLPSASQDLANECFRVGMNALILKPIVRRALIDRLRAIGIGRIEPATTEYGVAVTTALGHATRIQIFEHISRRGAMTATTLAAELDMNRQLALHHIKILRNAKLVDANPRGREMLFQATAGGLDAVALWMTRLGDLSLSAAWSAASSG